MPGGRQGGPSSLTHLFLCSENPFVPLFLPSVALRRRPQQRFHGLYPP